MTAIYRRELRGMFGGMMGWILVALWLLLGGWHTMRFNLLAYSSDLTGALEELALLMIFLMPFPAAHCFTRDQANGTLLWLRSLPAGGVGVTVGKYLAALTVFAIPTALYGLFPLLLANYGTVSYGTAYTALLGYFLLGTAWLAICCFAASRFRRFWVAVLVTLLLGVAVYFLDLIQMVFSALPLIEWLIVLAICATVGILTGIRRKNPLSGVLTGGIPVVVLTVCYFALRRLYSQWIPAVLEFLSLFGRFGGFCSGYFDLSAFTLYVGVIFLSGFFAIRYPRSDFRKEGKKQ